MNFIKLIFDEKTQAFDIEKNTEEVYPSPIETEIQLSLKAQEGGQLFNNIAFGFNLIKDDRTVLTERFPPLGVKIECCDSAPLSTSRVFLEKESEYVLEFWIENQTDKFEHRYDIVTGIPMKPYNSWTWDGNDWIPPIPAPENCDRRWDEDTLSWVVRSTV
jgi:hypothetical protein